jgi:hypothetical protein
MLKKGGDLLAVCKFFRPLTSGLKINCGNCAAWIGQKCDDEERVLQESIKADEFAKLMRHDAYERGHSGIRQIRRG